LDQPTNLILFTAPLWVALLIAAVILFVWARRGFQTRGKRLAKLLAMGLVIIVVIGLIAAAVPTGQTGVNQATFEVTLAEGTCFDFTAFTTDDNCATGSGEIVVDDVGKQVTVIVTITNSADTVSPDSYAVQFTVRRTDPGWVEAGQVVQVPITAALNTALPTLQNTTSGLTVTLVEQDSNGMDQIAWTDTSSNTIVGQADAGSVGLLSPGGSGTVTFSLYFNENALPNLQGNGPAATETFNLNFTVAGVSVLVVLSLTFNA
jgi:hypothetical protein